MIIKSRCLIAGSLLLLATAAFAAEPAYPAYSGFVNDFAGAIDSPTKQKMEELCQTLEQKTSAELAIVTVRSVAPLDSKEYAVKLFEKWKIGKKGKDNGILMLLAMEERRVEIEVGYGLEGIMNDSKAGRILDEYVIPSFKQGKFADGLYNGAEAIAGEIMKAGTGEVVAKSSGVDKDNDLGWIAVIVGGIVLLVLLSIFASGLVSGFVGAVMGVVFGYAFMGIFGAVLGGIIGFMLSYAKMGGPGSFGGWGGGLGGGDWGGGGGGGFSFGGGGSGGGGSGRSW